MPAAGERMIERARELRLADADDAPVQWSRTAAVAGGLVTMVVVLGALLGLNASDGEDAQAAQTGVTAALPKPKPVAATALAEATAPSPRMADMQPRPAHAVALVRTTRTAAAPKPAAAENPLSLAAAPGETRLADLEIGPAIAEPSPVETAAALPLSNATIARTIERIGYSCGKVASTAPAEGGGPGVYTVTCTSGQSYRAAPVHGRYRFRRVGGH